MTTIFTGCGTRGTHTAKAAQWVIPDSAAIDAEAKRLMARENVQGLALAVIDNGRIVDVSAFGHRNVARDLPLTTSTIMYGASLTKTAITYMVMQLVDEGRLDLDASVAKLLPQPLPEYDSEDYDYTDLAGDARWKLLTPRIILTHSTGFANFRWLEPDKKLRFHFTPGTRYGYSGEGFYILQLILEQGLGIDVGKAMQTRVFDRLGMTNTSMMWRPDFANNLADGYALDGSVQPHDERSQVSAAGSMDTSIEDQAKLWAAIVRGDGLNAAARSRMFAPELAITSAHEFPSLAPAVNPHNADIRLAAGLGLVTFEDATGPAFFKGGHNDWTGNMVLCLRSEQRCVVMLANDVRAERIYPALARFILGDTKMPWHWEYEWLQSPALPRSRRKIRRCQQCPRDLRMHDVAVRAGRWAALRDDGVGVEIEEGAGSK
jgi:CubicO group peptidase (beta-lactamase class C family)